MKVALVDTDVVSILFKQDTRAKIYETHIADRLLYISFMTLAELDQWALVRNWGRDRPTELGEYLRPFSVLYADRKIFLKWAEVSDKSRRIGRPIETADAWIAATALLYRVP